MIRKELEGDEQKGRRKNPLEDLITAASAATRSDSSQAARTPSHLCTPAHNIPRTALVLLLRPVLRSYMGGEVRGVEAMWLHQATQSAKYSVDPYYDSKNQCKRSLKRNRNLNKKNLNMTGEEISVKGRCRQKVKRRKQKSDLVLIREVCSNTVKRSCETLVKSGIEHEKK
ncbi:hypothetical protein F511_14530 [Dorcoceras hygrometricum]|uniref:Uncharacterized protein n=1 Tax=Dorcoceras hygrometricum TaxID=472368 RepID=A0A2Z7A3N9_9LAMI|nr:hypothetical protein F511_14530 [Dorcoceras hygrometricum]